MNSRPGSHTVTLGVEGNSQRMRDTEWIPERPAGPSKVIHIIGAPGSGKSALRQKLTEALALPASGIDDERVRLLRPGERWPAESWLAWDALRRFADAHADGCLIESSGVHPNATSMLRYRTVWTILCTASIKMRRQRLGQRGRSYPLANQPDYLQRVMRVPEPADESADYRWDGSTPFDGPEFARLVEECRRFVGIGV